MRSGKSKIFESKPILIVLVPFVLVVTIAVGFVWWERGAPPGFQPTAHDVAISEITRDHRGVRVHGTAHYGVQVRQQTADGDQAWTLFPLFEKGDVEGRQIRVMIRTTREPDQLYSYEDLTVEGLARPPGRLVPSNTQESLLKMGYDFSEGFVLIEEFDED